MQFKIPQEISGEDKLVGPLSLRQLIIVGIGGGFAYMIFISLAKVADPIIYIPPMAIIVLITLAIAFFRKDNLSFTHLMLLLIESVINPTQRVWVMFAGDVSPFKIIESYAQAEVQKVEKKAAQDVQKIDDISKLVSILDYNTNDEIARENEARMQEAIDAQENRRGGLLEKFGQEAAQKIGNSVRSTPEEDALLQTGRDPFAQKQP